MITLVDIALGIFAALFIVALVAFLLYIASTPLENR